MSYQTTRHNITKFLISLLTWSLTLASSSAYAIDPNSTLPIDIESDTATLNEPHGTSLYEGNVIISQGSTRLLAERILVSAPNQKITSIEASGGPAHFEQQDESNKMIRGLADKITYIAKDSKLRFEGNAELSQQNNSFSGDLIEYDIAKRAIKAQGDEVKGERVKIQYHPNPKPEKDSSETSTPNPSTDNE